MQGKIRNYYAGGNTCVGFYNYFESNLQGLDRLFILKGGPGTGKSTLMKEVGAFWVDKGYDIEFLHCSSDNNSIDGVLIPALKAGIVDGTAPHVIEPTVPGAIEDYVNLGEAWNSKKLSKHKAEILALKNDISEAFKKAYAIFDDALRIHDEWELVYNTKMDFDKADEVANRLMTEIFEDKALNKKAVIKHRFFGAATPEGPVDFIQNLTEDIKVRYFVKGRPGTGKSTLLKKLAEAAEQKGIDVEVYHCGFHPDSVDMLIFRELGIAIFDSTAPHEYFPDRESDRVVDMYSDTIAEGTDEQNTEKLFDITERYRTKMLEGTYYLARAKEWHDDMEKYYIDAMDFQKVKNIKDALLLELQELAE